MPDITMCKGEGCAQKTKCYRFCAKPDQLQSYFSNSPIKDGECKYFWPHTKKEKKDMDEALR